MLLGPEIYYSATSPTLMSTRTQWHSPRKRGSRESQPWQQSLPKGPLPPRETPGATKGNGSSCQKNSSDTFSPSSPALVK